MQVSIDLQAQVSVAKAWLVSLVLFVFHQCNLGLCFSKRNQIPKLNKEILGNWLELCCCCCLEHGLILKMTPKENSIFRLKQLLLSAICMTHVRITFSYSNESL